MRQNILPLLITFLFLLSCQSDEQAEINDLHHQVDQIFSKWDRPDAPGCALAVVQNGKIVYSAGYGMADLEHNIPISDSSVFYIGSVSKQFVAMCILLLEEQGKLKLTDDVRQYVPELPNYGNTIEIQHLIHHTSGLRDNLELWALSGRDMLDDIPEEAALNLICRQKALNFMPGEAYAYSNSGYFLLAEIIKRISGKPLRAFAREHIFNPLGMENAWFNDDNRRLIPNRAFGYTALDSSEFGNLPMRFDLVGSGGLYTNARELYKWDQNFYNNQLGKGEQELIAKMYTNGKFDNGKEVNYAYAMIHENYRGAEAIYHTGSMGGYRAAYLRFPALQFSVIILGNLAQLVPIHLAHQVADVYLADWLTDNTESFEKEAEPTEEKQLVTISPGQLKEYMGTYYSEELEVNYQVRIQSGELRIKMGYQPAIWLQALGNDTFHTAYYTFKFLRDTQGTLSGLEVGVPGAEGVKFSKQSH